MAEYWHEDTDAMSKSLQEASNDNSSRDASKLAQDEDASTAGRDGEKERPSGLILKPRRFRITLWLLDEELKAEEELDELVGFECSYALNQIPYATVYPAHGINVDTQESSKIIDRLDSLIAEKAPVGIVVERDPAPYFATVSVTNEEDEDAEKWPKDKVFIFKGYIAGSSINKTGTKISTSIQLVHWLQDLAIVSAYSPRAHVSSAYDFAADMCRTYISDPEATLNGWQLIDHELANQHYTSTREGLSPSGTPDDKKNTIFDCLITVIQSVLKTAEAEMEKCIFGRIDQEYFDRQKRAINRIRSTLIYQDFIRSAISSVWDSIVTCIENTTVESWTLATVWDKLAGVYPSVFYYALVPTAGWCIAIPTPGCIPDTHIDLTQDEITSLYSRQPVAPVLGAVALANKTKERPTDIGQVTSYVPIMYPPQGKDFATIKQSSGGPIALVQMPSYLNTITVRTPPLAIVEEEITEVPKVTIRPRMEEARQKFEDSETKKEVLLYDLVKLEYLSRVFAGRKVNVTTGFRGDIVPGACVHVHVTPVVKNNKKEKDIDLYGTVEYVCVSMHNGEVSTNFSMSNIRDLKEYQSNRYNPDTVPFYEKIFDGTDTTLYCPFE